LLLCAFYFPPLGMGGVQRPLKFAKFLPEFGWDVTVLTPEIGPYPATDDSLMAELPASVEVVRIPWRDPGRFFRSRMHKRGDSNNATNRWALALQQWTRWPDDKRGFVGPAFEQATNIHCSRPFDAVLTTSPPPSIHQLGLLLKQRESIPWIADFRDPWLMRNDDWGPTAWHASYARRLRDRILKGADRIIAVNDAIANEFNARAPAWPVEIIHNGYDESDFESLPAIVRSPEVRTFALYGTLASPIDLAPVRRLLGEWQQSTKTPVRIRHIGVAMGGRATTLGERRGGGVEFSESGYLSHRAAIAELISADCVVLPVRPDSSFRTTVPGRVFEMLRSLRPVLLITERSQATRQLIAGLHGVWCVDWNDSEAGLRALDEIAALPPGAPARTVESITRFERREQADRLSEILGQVCRNTIPGAGDE
jgi:glycosyltransferase involved in cell wall biosynthesis